MSDACQWAAREGPVLYVAGRLEPDEEQRFEEHLLECTVCQTEVRAGLLTRDAFAGAENGAGSVVGASADRDPGERQRAGRWIWVPLAAAAVLAFVVFATRAGPGTGDLGVVEAPPLYYGVTVRERPGDSLVAAGMSAYSAGRYDRAAELLARGVAASGDSIPAVFFLGVIDLLQNRPEQALERLEAVRDLGATPYRAEARFYAARALLALDRPDDARVELEAVAASEHALAPEAAEILEELERRGL